MRTTSLLSVLVIVMAGSSTKAQEQPVDKPATQPATVTVTEAPVVAEIEKCGGVVRRVGNTAAGAVVEITLYGKQVTDVGLEHLKGLNELQILNLRHTKVSDQGVKRLQEALPKCHIER